MELENYVRSLINGRARIRHPALAGIGGDDIEAIKSLVTAVEGVEGLEINPSVGSALLTWDPEVLTVEALKEHTQTWLAFLAYSADTEDEEKKAAEGAVQAPAACICGEVRKAAEPAVNLARSAMDAAARVIVPDVKNVKRARRMAQNRIMLGLGAASVASLAFNKSSHGVLGWGFAAFALLHLWQHRTVL